MKTKITVVTPSYNQGAFLGETIRTVCAQRDYLHEYFVVDGGSTDESVDILQTNSNKIDWWVSERDSGQTHAIMKGFERATGDVLAWLNSDDIYLPNALAAVQKAFDQNPQLEILTGYMIKIDAESRVTEACRIAAPSINLIRKGFLTISQPTTFFKRSLFEQVGKLDLSFQCAMDADLWCRFYRAKPIWETLPRYVVGFRGHGNNKGLSPQWCQRYAEENRIVRNRYPEIKYSFSGLCSYRIQQIFTGVKAIEWWHTMKVRHQTIDALPNWLFD